MNRLIIVGSPRVDGRSAALAAQLFEACIEDCPQDEVALAPVSTLDIGGCLGCDCCRMANGEDGGVGFGGEACGVPDGVWENGGCEGADDGDAGHGEGSNGAAVSLNGESMGAAVADIPPACRCVIEDDMQELYPLLDDADELVVVSPVYFAGPPSQLKAILDRLQPYYWANTRALIKRPAVLHVVGEGGDPHGFDPLVGTVRSALSCAGFSLETVYDWVGKISDGGEIIAEADVRELDCRCAEAVDESQQFEEDYPSTNEMDFTQEVPHRVRLDLNSAPVGALSRKQGGGRSGASAKPGGSNASGKSGGGSGRSSKSGGSGAPGKSGKSGNSGKSGGAGKSSSAGKLSGARRSGGPKGGKRRG